MIMNGSDIKLCGEKVAIFIDSHNTHKAQRLLGFRLDYQKLQQYLINLGEDIYHFRTYIYIPCGRDDHSQSKFADAMENLHWRVLRKDQVLLDGEPKANVDVEITVDMVSLAHQSAFTVAYLVSGDNDLVPAVEHIQNLGLRVFVVSTTKGDSPIAGLKLRKVADGFIDLSEVRQKVAS